MCWQQVGYANEVPACQRVLVAISRGGDIHEQRLSLSPVQAMITVDAKQQLLLVIGGTMKIEYESTW